MRDRTCVLTQLLQQQGPMCSVQPAAAYCAGMAVCLHRIVLDRISTCVAGSQCISAPLVQCCVLLLAGHCLYNKPNGGWASSIDVYCTVSPTSSGAPAKCWALVLPCQSSCGCATNERGKAASLSLQCLALDHELRSCISTTTQHQLHCHCLHSLVFVCPGGRHICTHSTGYASDATLPAMALPFVCNVSNMC